MNRRKFILASSLLAAAGLGVWSWPRRWRYIVIHHSGGASGDIALLQRVHRERQPHDPIHAIPYHYVIGNGHGLAMGEVASDWRQEYDIWGGHLTLHNLTRNFLGIGVCLIGDFEKRDVPEPQYQALVKLTRTLMTRYDIPTANVTGHGMTPGESTQCPGSRFPMSRFKRDIA
ncbi:peptidoglycan recognition protein family protein [Hahella sp. NBU794]|uniref:peptidoglycan recognition protein family protein n=1 Tax=Hahella sp. NBU794 TaxID=3422590 RepID=UPI003D6EFABA